MQAYYEKRQPEYEVIYQKPERQADLLWLGDALPRDTHLVLFDNKYVHGSSTPISRTSPAGDTYQNRNLKDGSQHEVLKNFPTKKGLQTTLQPFCTDVAVLESTYFWFATGNLRG